MGNKTPVEAYLALDAKATSAEDMITKYTAKAETNRWEQCRIVHEAVTSGEYSRRSFAEAAGKSSKTVELQYKIWHAHGAQPASHRPTYTEAYAQAQNRPTGSERTAQMTAGNVRNLPAEDKAKVARELLADPEVADEIDDDLAEHVASRPELASKVTERVAEDDERRRPAPEPVERSKEDRLTAAMIAMRAVRRKIDDVTAHLSGVDWHEQEIVAITGELDAWEQAIEMVRTGVTSGSWDAQLADLLGEGEH